MIRMIKRTSSPTNPKVAKTRRRSLPKKKHRRRRRPRKRKNHRRSPLGAKRRRNLRKRSSQKILLREPKRVHEELPGKREEKARSPRYHR